MLMGRCSNQSHAYAQQKQSHARPNECFHSPDAVTRADSCIWAMELITDMMAWRERIPRAKIGVQMRLTDGVNQSGS